MRYHTHRLYINHARNVEKLSLLSEGEDNKLES
jgi:hypothetical protein